MPYREAVRRFSPRCEQEERDRERMLESMALFPDVLTRRNGILHFTASCWICNEARDRVLMAFHNLYRSWAWTGGHADGDGDLLRVALREAGEETGLLRVRPALPEPISLEILGVEGHRKRGEYVGAHLHLNLTYLLVASDRDALFAKPDENSRVAWMTPEEAVESSAEACMKPIYEKLNARLADVD